MPVKQAEISSWRREASVGVEMEGGAGVLVLAIDIFVGLGGWIEWQNPGTGNWESGKPGTELGLRRSKTAALWGTL